MNKTAVANELLAIAKMLTGSSKFQEGDVVYFDKDDRKIETEVKKVIMQKVKWFYEVDKSEEPVAEIELRRAASSMCATTGTFKCPNCGTKVLENTGYCVKCEKKVKQAVGESRLRKWEDLTEKFRHYYPRWEVSELPTEVLYHPMLMFAISKYPEGDYAKARNQIEEGYPIGGFGPKSVGTLSDSQYEAIKRDPIAGLIQMRGPDRVMNYIRKINLDTRWSSMDWQKLIYGNRPAVARELLAIARNLMAMEFPTQDAYDKYMKEHPDADKSLHRVVETKKEPVKKEEPKKVGGKSVTTKKGYHAIADYLVNTWGDDEDREGTYRWMQEVAGIDKSSAKKIVEGFQDHILKNKGDIDYNVDEYLRKLLKVE